MNKIYLAKPHDIPTIACQWTGNNIEEIDIFLGGKKCESVIYHNDSYNILHNGKYYLSYDNTLMLKLGEYFDDYIPVEIGLYIIRTLCGSSWYLSTKKYLESKMNVCI